MWTSYSNAIDNRRLICRSHPVHLVRFHFALFDFLSLLPSFPRAHLPPCLVSTWGWLSIKHGRGLKKRRRRQMEVKEEALVLLAFISCASIHVYIYCCGCTRPNMEDDCRWSWQGHVCLLIRLSVWCTALNAIENIQCVLLRKHLQPRESNEALWIFPKHLKFSMIIINKC